MSTQHEIELLWKIQVISHFKYLTLTLLKIKMKFGRQKERKKKKRDWNTLWTSENISIMQHYIGYRKGWRNMSQMKGKQVCWAPAETGEENYISILATRKRKLVLDKKVLLFSVSLRTGKQTKVNSHGISHTKQQLKPPRLPCIL